MKYYRNDLGSELVVMNVTLNGVSVLGRAPGDKGFCFMTTEKDEDAAKRYVEYMRENAGFYEVDPGELKL